MKKGLFYLILVFLVILSLIIGAILSEYLKLDVLFFSISNAIVLAIIVVIIMVIGFILIAGSNSDSEAKHALGLPNGSVRAILALTILVLFVLVAVYFYLSSNKNDEVAKNITTILGTLVIAVSSFYFGIKATEQGSTIVQTAYDKVTPENKKDESIDPSIIQDAISVNKGKWIKKYNCIDVKLGKKVADQKTFEMNCIIFIVADKKTPNKNSEIIPPAIPHTYKGQEYSIPTDVRVQ